MANANIQAIQAAITTMQNWITWASTQKEAESGQMLMHKYDEFVRHQLIAMQVAQDLLAIYAQKGIA
jgi:hypothetical protein